MSTIIMVLLLLMDVKAQEISNKPNIIFMWFDDLGFADVGFNGGEYPTPVLDNLSAKSIKLNFHYVEAVCSPSRSSLYTGRYPWLTGINKVVPPQSHSHIDRSLTFYPQLFQNDGYNTFITGKWHIGYKYSDTLPGKKGFDDGIYSLVGLQYYEREISFPFTKYDRWYPLDDDILRDRTALFGHPGTILPAHDTWAIDDNGDPTAILVGDTTYNEKIFTDGIVSFIDKQSAANPFYIHYNLFTPHVLIEEPPALDTNFAYQYDICTDLSVPPGKILFCKAMLYAQERIDEIVNKVKSKGLWQDTLIVITSDNGPQTISYGHTLPLRGIKTSENEGGIRTASFIIGGYIENVLNSATPSVTSCEYNNMVHISDWFNILTEIANINHDTSDSDHNSLQIWQDIKCNCNEACGSNYEQRTELINMRLCGDNFAALPFDSGSNWFYGTTIIKNGWKLIVNSSYGVTDGCPNTAGDTGLQAINTWQGYTTNTYTIPNQEFFNRWYLPQFIADEGRANTLYKSECLEALNGNDDINNPSYPEFTYGDSDEFMLFDLNTDKIEACNLANAVGSQYTDKINELLAILETRSGEYNREPDTESSVGAMWELVNSYDCTTQRTYLLPWDGQNEDKCGPIEETINDITARDCSPIWQRLNEIKQNCPNETNGTQTTGTPTTNPTTFFTQIPTTGMPTTGIPTTGTPTIATPTTDPTQIVNFIATPTLNWQDADDNCGGNIHLVSVTSESNKDIITQYLTDSGTQSAWIGLKRNTATNAFEWADGTICSENDDNCVPASFWGPNGPGATTDCVLLSNRGRFRTGDCNRNKPYFCSVPEALPAYITDQTESSSLHKFKTYLGLIAFVGFVLLTILIGCIFLKSTKKVAIDIIDELPNSIDSRKGLEMV